MSAEPPGVLLVTRAAELEAVAAELAACRRLGVDTESASFHRYNDRVYLVQLSSDERTVVIDPLAVADLRPLGDLLADPAIEVVFHDADYDLRTLERDYGFRARNVFDTRIAAQLAGERAVSLDALLDKYLHTKLDKKLQRADWSQRPLSPAMLAYAAADTRYLPPLRDLLETRLAELGRLEWAGEEFRRLEEVQWTGSPGGDAEAYLRIKGAKALSPRALAILRALHTWRDAIARRHDRAPFRVVGNAALVAIARRAPRTPDQLAALPELPPTLARRHGGELLGAVRDGMKVPAAELPRRQHGVRPGPDPQYEARLERLKLLRNRRAAEIALDPGLVCPNATLQAIARAAPTSVAQLDGMGELRRWQRDVLGEGAILETVRGET